MWYMHLCLCLDIYVNLDIYGQSSLSPSSGHAQSLLGTATFESENCLLSHLPPLLNDIHVISFWSHRMGHFHSPTPPFPSLLPC